eukprot:g267.t1
MREKTQAGEKFQELKKAEKESKRIRKFFKMIDRDDSGLIDRGEINSVLKKMNVTANEEQMKVAFDNMDVSGDGYVDFKEFEVFYKALSTAKGGINAAFQSYMDTFKCAETVQESMRNFYNYLGLTDAKGLKKKMERSGVSCDTLSRYLVHPPKSHPLAEANFQRSVDLQVLDDDNKTATTTGSENDASDGPKPKRKTLTQEARKRLYVFLCYASPGDSLNAGYMTLSQFHKYVHDCQLVDFPQIIRNAHLIYAKIARSSNGKFTLDEWEASNQLIADRVFRSVTIEKTRLQMFYDDYVYKNAKHIRVDPLMEYVSDPEIRLLMRKVQWPLYNIFKHYSRLDDLEDQAQKPALSSSKSSSLTTSTSKRTTEKKSTAWHIRQIQRTTISLNEFVIFLRNFDVLGDRGQRSNDSEGGAGVLSLTAAANIFRAANLGTAGDEDVNNINFQEFMDSMIRVALHIYPLADVEEQIRLHGEHPIVTFTGSQVSDEVKRRTEAMFPLRDPNKLVENERRKRNSTRVSQMRREKVAEQFIRSHEDHSFMHDLFYHRRLTVMKPDEKKLYDIKHNVHDHIHPAPIIEEEEEEHDNDQPEENNNAAAVLPEKIEVIRPENNNPNNMMKSNEIRQTENPNSATAVIIPTKPSKIKRMRHPYNHRGRKKKRKVA